MILVIWPEKPIQLVPIHNKDLYLPAILMPLKVTVCLCWHTNSFFPCSLIFWLLCRGFIVVKWICSLETVVRMTPKLVMLQKHIQPVLYVFLCSESLFQMMVRIPVPHIHFKKKKKCYLWIWLILLPNS